MNKTQFPSPEAFTILKYDESGFKLTFQEKEKQKNQQVFLKESGCGQKVLPLLVIWSLTLSVIVWFKFEKTSA